MKENKIETEADNTEDLAVNSMVVEEVKKTVKKRNRPDLAKFGEENTEPGDNSRYLRHAMASWNLPPIDISDPKQVENRIVEYFTYCEQNDRKPNIKGLGNWLGVSSETVMNWRKGIYREDTHLGVIKKAVDMLEELWWDYGQNGKTNPASWIFIGKNAFGMKDQQDITIRPDSPYGEQKTIEQIEREYAALPE